MAKADALDEYNDELAQTGPEISSESRLHSTTSPRTEPRRATAQRPLDREGVRARMSIARPSRGRRHSKASAGVRKPVFTYRRSPPRYTEVRRL